MKLGRENVALMFPKECYDLLIFCNSCVCAIIVQVCLGEVADELTREDARTTGVHKRHHRILGPSVSQGQSNIRREGGRCAHGQ